jgi:hypothetical protein
MPPPSTPRRFDSLRKGPRWSCGAHPCRPGQRSPPCPPARRCPQPLSEPAPGGSGCTPSKSARMAWSRSPISRSRPGTPSNSFAWARVSQLPSRVSPFVGYLGHRLARPRLRSRRSLQVGFLDQPADRRELHVDGQGGKPSFHQCSRYPTKVSRVRGWLEPSGTPTHLFIGFCMLR